MVTLIEGYVWCDTLGMVHEDVPDPEEVGPGRPSQIHDEEGWKLEERDGWPGRLWHYTCPGPHHLLWMGREIRKEEK